MTSWFELFLSLYTWVGFIDWLSLRANIDEYALLDRKNFAFDHLRDFSALYVSNESNSLRFWDINEYMFGSCVLV